MKRQHCACGGVTFLCTERITSVGEMEDGVLGWGFTPEGTGLESVICASCGQEYAPDDFETEYVK